MTTVKLSVPYYYQVDNNTDYFGTGYRQCNLTAHAMMVAYLQPEFVKRSVANGFDEPESYYGSKLYKYGDTTDHNAHTQCLRHEFRIESRWCTQLSKSEIISQIDNKYPVPAGVIYKSSGHIVLIVGYTDDGFLIHDPYGTRDGSADIYAVGVGGSYDFYSWGLLNKVYFDAPGEGGWGRLVTAC
jgi:uncharacterized protein YvpB